MASKMKPTRSKVKVYLRIKNQVSDEDSCFQIDSCEAELRTTGPKTVPRTTKVVTTVPKRKLGGVKTPTRSFDGEDEESDGLETDDKSVVTDETSEGVDDESVMDEAVEGSDDESGMDEAVMDDTSEGADDISDMDEEATDTAPAVGGAGEEVRGSDVDPRLLAANKCVYYQKILGSDESQYKFSGIFPGVEKDLVEKQNEVVFRTIADPAIENAKRGYSTTIIAYGNVSAKSIDINVQLF